MNRYKIHESRPPIQWPIDPGTTWKINAIGLLKNAWIGLDNMNNATGFNLKYPEIIQVMRQKDWDKEKNQWLYLCHVKHGDPGQKDSVRTIIAQDFRYYDRE